MPIETKYFVLKPRAKSFPDQSAYSSRRALETYAAYIDATDAELATELRQWVQTEELKLRNRVARQKKALESVIEELKHRNWVARQKKALESVANQEPK